MSADAITLRSYNPSDETAAIELWRRTWQAAYPEIDFAARVPWWRERWRSELLPQAEVIVAETGGVLIGFVTVDPATGYLDQIVVAPEAWGGKAAAVLLAEARQLSPTRLDLHVNADNARAIQFYRKHGFVFTGEAVNPVSGRPVSKMSWRA